VVKAKGSWVTEDTTVQKIRVLWPLGSSKHSHCRKIDSFSFTELHNRTGNTSCSTLDIRTKEHQIASLHRGLKSQQNTPPTEKNGKTNFSLISDISAPQILRIALMLFTFTEENKNES